MELPGTEIVIGPGEAVAVRDHQHIVRSSCDVDPSTELTEVLRRVPRPMRPAEGHAGDAHSKCTEHGDDA